MHLIGVLYQEEFSKIHSDGSYFIYESSRSDNTHESKQTD